MDKTELKKLLEEIEKDKDDAQKADKVDSSVSDIVEKLGDKIKEAIKESKTASNSDAQVATAKLDAVLRATGGDFDTLKKKATDLSKSFVRLGFDDEDTALAFGRFVSVTKDANQAQRWLQATLDYSRFKSIDLESATNLMVRAMENGGRVAKDFGLNLDANASSLQVLGAIEAQVKGQSEAFGGIYRTIICIKNKLSKFTRGYWGCFFSINCYCIGIN